VEERGRKKGVGSIDGTLLKGSSEKLGKEGGGSGVGDRLEEGEGRRGGPGTTAGGAGQPVPT
jgi:hypothetical protein